MSTKVLRNVMSVFVLCSLVMCVSGCTTPIHVPLSEDHIPLGVQELVKQCADPDVFKINKLEYMCLNRKMTDILSSLMQRQIWYIMILNIATSF